MGRAKKISYNMKKYVALQLAFRGVNTEFRDAMFVIAELLEDNKYNDKYKSILKTDLKNRIVIAEKMEITDRAVQKILNAMVKTKILIPVKRENGRAVRAEYYVEDWLFPINEYNRLNELKCEFDFMSMTTTIRKELKDEE